jgi:hypothetical protein
VRDDGLSAVECGETRQIRWPERRPKASSASARAQTQRDSTRTQNTRRHLDYVPARTARALEPSARQACIMCALHCKCGPANQPPATKP